MAIISQSSVFKATFHFVLILEAPVDKKPFDDMEYSSKVVFLPGLSPGTGLSRVIGPLTLTAWLTELMVTV